MTHREEVAENGEVEDQPQADPDVEIEGIEEEDESLEWEERAREAMRQILTQKVDLPISRLGQMIDEGEVDLAPEFQRRDRWKRAQQSRLVESIIMNVPIPPVFLGEDQPGKFVVLDGRQRLTAIHDYLDDKYSLSGLDVWEDLNGKRFRQLKDMGDPPISSAITRRFVPAVIILHESLPDVKYEVFDRLNTGGVIAEAMEVRNAIYRGGFNSLLHEVTDSTAFRHLWNIPVDDKARRKNGAYRKMADLEMALRFFAFQHYGEFKGSLKKYLNRFMSNRNEQYHSDPSLLDSDRELFLSTMSQTLDLLGSDALHRLSAPNERSEYPSAPLADAILYAMSRIPDDVRSKKAAKAIRKAIDDLCLEDPEFVKAITVGTNARTAARYRVETAEEKVKAALGL